MCMWTCREALSSEQISEMKKHTKLIMRKMDLPEPNCRNRPGAEVMVTSSPKSECPRAQTWRLCMFGSAN